MVSILDIGKGMVLPGVGQAEFVTRYRAIVYKPFKGEVVDGVVGNVTKVGGVEWVWVCVCGFVLVAEVVYVVDGVLC